MKKLIKTIFIAGVIIMHAITNVSAATLVFDPAEENAWTYHGVFYGRGLQLKCDEAGENKGNIYATSEYYYHPGKGGLEHFPIFESTDGGENFSHISDIYETEYNTKKYLKAGDGSYYEVPEGTEGATTFYDEWWSMIYQPMLFELPHKIGELEKGTIICGGAIKSANHSAIVVYCSTDSLKTWKYLSTIAIGGQEITGRGSAVWEPFFICENDALYCFYSDERGMTAGGGQRLVFTKTTDGIHWGKDVKICDFEAENKHFRPGMPMIAKMQNGKYVFIYEGVNMHNGYLPTYYKISDDIEVWDYTDHGIMLPRPLDGGSPYCAVMNDGTIVVGAHATNKVAINTDNLETNTWTLIDTDVENAYSRCLVPLMDGRLLIVSAGAINAPDPHKITAGVMEITIPGEIDLTNAKVEGTTPWGKVEPDMDNNADNVIDENPATFFDGYPDGHVVIDLGKEYKVSGIGYQPRCDFAFRASGGRFYGSVDGEVWTKLYTIPTLGANNAMNYVLVEEGYYRYVKYTSNGEEFCNMSEIKLYSTDMVRVNVNGQTIECREEPMKHNGVWLVPLRAVAEAAGANVAWINDTRSVAVVFEGKLLILNIDSKVYRYDNRDKTAQVETILIDGKTYVPFEIIEEALNCSIVTKGNTLIISR